MVRLLAGDDPGQTQVTKRLFESGTVWIAKTVLPETAWVLNKTFGLDNLAIRDFLL